MLLMSYAPWQPKHKHSGDEFSGIELQGHPWKGPKVCTGHWQQSGCGGEGLQVPYVLVDLIRFCSLKTLCCASLLFMGWNESAPQDSCLGPCSLLYNKAIRSGLLMHRSE